MDSVVDIMGRLATVAESRSGNIGGNIGGNTGGNIVENTGGDSKMIVPYFTKRDYDLSFPVPAKNLDMPLIEFVKKAKLSNKHFFSFKSACRDLLKSDSGEIAISYKEENLTVTLNQLKADSQQYTVRNLYCMSDIKTSHHHISFFVQRNLLEEDDKEFEDYNFQIINIYNTSYDHISFFVQHKLLEEDNKEFKEYIFQISNIYNASL